MGWGALLRPWLEISPTSVALAFLLVLMSYGLRTVRIYHYFSPLTRGGFLRTFRLVLVHNLLNNLLPMRSGEVSFPILMKRDFGVSFIQSTPALVFLRLLDLHFLLLLGAGVFASSHGRWSWVLPLLLLPLPLLGIRTALWVRRERVEGADAPLTGVTWLNGLPGSVGSFAWTWIWTVVNWSVKLLVFAWILGAFSAIPLPQAILGSITGELSSVLPFHGLAGAGTYEAGVMAALVPLGVEMESALAGAVNLHLFVLGASILAGALGLTLPVGRGRARGSFDNSPSAGGPVPHPEGRVPPPSAFSG